MVQQCSFKRRSSNRLGQCLWLAGGLGWLSSVGVFNSYPAIAQEFSDPLSAETLAVPSAQDLLQDALPNVTPEYVPEPSAADLGDSIPVEAAPTESWDDAMSGDSVNVELLDRSEGFDWSQAPGITGGEDSGYIDASGDYNLGATQPSDQPSVVLSERSTGCETVLADGQALSESCTGASIPSEMPSSDVSSVTLGPVSVGTDGIAFNSNYFVNNFYDAASRPLGRSGNNNARLIFPLSIPSPITSLFGWRLHPISGDMRFHSGTDIGAPMGTPVLAAFSGEVVTADFLQGYGLTVIVQHNDGTLETLYGHMSQIFVQVGDQVAQGEAIGRVGSTGNSTGPHLHFEVRELTDEGWVAMNPNYAVEQALADFDGTFPIAGGLNSLPPLPPNVAQLPPLPVERQAPRQSGAKLIVSPQWVNAIALEPFTASGSGKLVEGLQGAKALHTEGVFEMSNETELPIGDDLPTIVIEANPQRIAE